jgi:quinate dehydrogenase (quinone)
VVFCVVGLVLALGGMRLIGLGGSWYYFIAGGLLVVSGVLLWQGKAAGAVLYAVLTGGTLVWALWEAGFDGWALAPRVLPFLVLGLFLLRPRLRRTLFGGASQPLLRSPIAWVSIVVLAVIGIGVARRAAYATAEFPTTQSDSAEVSDWRHWGRTQRGTRYIPFDQINAQNVGALEVAWTYRTGIGGAFKGTPLQVGDTLYVCNAGNIVSALDAETGQRRWQFDPQLKDSKVGFTTTCRGVTWFETPGASECAQRILTATTDARLIAIDAKTGSRCASFGVNGDVDLIAGMGDVKPGFYYVTSPPTNASGVAVLGGWIADNVEVQEPSGVIRGFDPVSGQLLWAWDLGRPDVLTLPQSGQTYTRGTPNAWSVFSADDALGLVYIPTGNATPDYYGGHRSPESEKYASSVVALDAKTGAVRWSFQTTHHDIWDYDVPSQPVLVDLKDKVGNPTPALVAPTKRGELFLLDRRTGAPLADVEERSVPQTDVPQEWTSKTQPFSVGMPSFAGEPLRERDMWGITPIDQMMCRIAFRKLRYEGPLTPPSLTGSIQYPGFAGGMNWGSVSVDEPHQVMIVNSLHMANHVQLHARATVTKDTVLGFGGGQQSGTPYAAYTSPFFSPIFAPCQEPPYGEIAAVDLATRSVLWRRPLGTANEVGPLGMKVRVPLPMGIHFSGGTIVTKGGVLFMAGTVDRHIRALDVRTGRILWSDKLPNNAQATPMSYMTPGGRQLVVIAVQSAAPLEIGHETMGQDKLAPSGGWLIAYGLPLSK